MNALDIPGIDDGEIARDVIRSYRTVKAVGMLIKKRRKRQDSPLLQEANRLCDEFIFHLDLKYKIGVPNVVQEDDKKSPKSSGGGVSGFGDSPSKKGG